MHWSPRRKPTLVIDISFRTRSNFQLGLFMQEPAAAFHPLTVYFHSKFQMCYRVSTFPLQIFCPAHRAANHKQKLQLFHLQAFNLEKRSTMFLTIRRCHGIVPFPSDSRCTTSRMGQLWTNYLCVRGKHSHAIKKCCARRQRRRCAQPYTCASVSIFIACTHSSE